jgi:hypothetical protein
MFSNLKTYLTIAEDALAEAERLDAASRKPMPNGKPGFIMTFDPDRRSFKQSLIALVFAGVYLEALMYIVGTQRLGKDAYMKLDRKKYEEKLVGLGISDPELLSSCKRFRESRNDLVHEKAIEIEKFSAAHLRNAQEEAKFGVDFVRSVANVLLSD